MADLVTRLKLANNEFNSGIDSSKKKVKELQETADDTSKSIQDLGNKGAKSAKELLSEMADTEKAGRSASNYKRQLMEIQRTIADLTIGYRQMSDEMKNSALGQEVANKIHELTNEAAMYKDAIEDANASIKALASDTSGWDGLKQGIDTASAALQGFVAMGVLGEESTEKLVAVIAKLKAIEAATNAVIKIGNALQKQSALMQGIARIQSAALTKAKVAETAATKGATIAQKAFNLVAKANPYVLLATAVLAVGAALFAFTKRTKEATDAESKAVKKTNEMKKAMEEVNGEAGTTIAKFSLLQQQYKLLKTEAEKQQWIKDNKKNFEDLNISIKNVNDADDVFIKNAAKVIRAMQLRAEVSAMMAEYEKQYAEAYKESLKLQSGRQQAYQSSSSVRKEWKQAGLTSEDYTQTTGTMPSTVGAVNWTMFTLNESGKQKLDAYYEQMGKEYMDKFTEGAESQFTVMQQKLAEATKLENEAGHFGVTPTTSDTGIKAMQGSLQEAQNKVSELQTKLNNLAPDNEKFEETKEELIKWQNEVERLQKLYKTISEQELYPAGSLKEAQHFVTVFQNQLQELDPKSDEFQDVLDLLNIWKTRVEEINKLMGKTDEEIPTGTLAEANKKVTELTQNLTNLKPGTKEFVDVITELNKWKKIQQEIQDVINGTDTQLKTVVDLYKEIVAEADAISLRVQIGDLDPSEGRKQIAGLNKKLKSLGLSAKVELEFDSDLTKIKNSINQITDMIYEPVSAINNVKSAYKSMMDSFEDPDSDGWEKFFATFQFGITIVDAVTSILTVLNTITELLTASKVANTSATTAETAAATADATAQSADAAATVTNAAAHGAAAAASAGQSVASIPYVGPILAIAAIISVMAAIVGIIASAKGFATGGIVDAPSKLSDKNIIRVNGGEMILNNRQQANLFKMLDEGRRENSNGIAGDVKFRINGTDLVGCLNNYNHKQKNI